MILNLFLIMSSIIIFFYTFYFLYIYFNSKKEKKDIIIENDYAPSVSVIIPTYNEEIMIKRKLKNISQQKYYSYDVNIIDSASKDKTVDMIEEYINENGAPFNFIIENERRGKSYALNKILKEVKGEIIAITDADVLWHENAICNMVKNFHNKNIGAITGRQIVVDKDSDIFSGSEKAYKNIFDILRMGESKIDSTMIFNGPAMAFRAELVDPLPEDTIADDTQLAMMIRKKGFKTIFDDSVIFYESVPDDKNFLNQKIRRGQGLVQAFFRNMDFLFNPKFGKFGLILFPAEFFMHIISPIICLIMSILLFVLILNETFFLYGFFVSLAALLLFSKLNVLKIDKIFFAFIEYQFILLLSLISHIVGFKQHKWNVVDRNVIELGKGE